MRVLTVKEPWASLIIMHGKSIETRSQNIAGGYRGPVAIHVALKALPAEDPAWGAAANAGMIIERRRHPWGRIIGVVDLVDVSPATTRTETASDHGSGASEVRDGAGTAEHWHLHLENPYALDEPIPYTGGVALRRLDTSTGAKVFAQLREAGASPRASARMVARDAGVTGVSQTITPPCTHDERRLP